MGNERHCSVLILLLVEYGLWLGDLWRDGQNFRTVLILLLVEYGLWLCGVIHKEKDVIKVS